MSIRQRVAAKAPKFQGQKSGLPIESYGIDSGELIQNFYLSNGQLIKVNGGSQVSEVLPETATGGVLSLHNFKDVVIAQRDLRLAINGSIVYGTSYVDAGGTGLTSRLRLYSHSWRDRLVMTNTQDAVTLFYTDTSASFKWFGLDPIPVDTVAAPVYFNATGAGNVNDEVHYYMLSLYDSTTNTESPCMGSLPSADGIYELSPNGFLGPRPSASATPGSAQIYTFGGGVLKTLVDAGNALSQNRATHFIVYRSRPKVNGLYQSFFAVPLKDGSDYDGSIYIPISALSGAAGSPGGSIVGDFVDNTSNANLPAISPPENNSPPPTPARLKYALNWYRGIGNNTPENWELSDYSGFRHIRFFRDQMFGIGAKSFGFTVSEDVSFGDVTTQKVTGKINNFNNILHGSEVYQPDYWPYRWEVGRGTGQDATALGVLGDVALLCFLEGSTYYLTGSSPDNYVVRIMDTQKGAIHQSTVQETSIGVISLDRSGFVLWDKIGQGKPIGDDIQNYIDDGLIDFTQAANFYSCYDAKRQLYRCSVAVPGAPTNNGLVTPNLTFILDLRSMQWTTEYGSEGLCRIQFSVNSSNLTSRAIANGELSGVTIDTGKVYDLVGSAQNGRIYDYSSGAVVTNHGNAIYGVWTSGTINFGDDQHKKKMKWVYLRAKSQTGWKVNIEVIPDYDESRKFVLENWDVVSSQSLWYSSDAAVDGSLLWDSGNGSDDGGRWASDGLVRQVSKIPVQCIGYSFQIRIIHQETDATRYGFSIESVSAEGVMLGR